MTPVEMNDVELDRALAAYSVPALSANFASRVVAEAQRPHHRAKPPVPRARRRPWLRRQLIVGVVLFNLIAASAIAAVMTGHSINLSKLASLSRQLFPIHRVEHIVRPIRVAANQTHVVRPQASSPSPLIMAPPLQAGPHVEGRLSRPDDDRLSAVPRGRGFMPLMARSPARVDPHVHLAARRSLAYRSSHEAHAARRPEERARLLADTSERSDHLSAFSSVALPNTERMANRTDAAQDKAMPQAPLDADRERRTSTLERPRGGGWRARERATPGNDEPRFRRPRLGDGQQLARRGGGWRMGGGGRRRRG